MECDSKIDSERYHDFFGYEVMMIWANFVTIQKICIHSDFDVFLRMRWNALENLVDLFRNHPNWGNIITINVISSMSSFLMNPFHHNWYLIMVYLPAGGSLSFLPLHPVDLQSECSIFGLQLLDLLPLRTATLLVHYLDYLSHLQCSYIFFGKVEQMFMRSWHKWVDLRTVLAI